MKKVIGVISAALVVLALHAPAQAIDLRIGGNLNYGTSSDVGIGPRIELGLEDYVPGLRLAADYHKFFDSEAYGDINGLTVDASSWDLGLHILYDFTTLAIAVGATLYAGAGLLYADRTYDHSLKPTNGVASAEDYDSFNQLQEKYQSDSGASLALTVGSTFNTGWTVVPFVEARYTIGVVDELMLAVGILFSTGMGAK